MNQQQRKKHYGLGQNQKHGINKLVSNTPFQSFSNDAITNVKKEANVHTTSINLDKCQKELFDLLDDISNKKETILNKKEKPKRKCKFCGMIYTNLHRHLRKANHSFLCNYVNCGFVSENVQHMKNHLFAHYVKNM